VKYILKYNNVHGRILTFFLSFIIITITATPLFAQEAGVKSTRQSSIEAFSKGDYEKAYSSFSDLLMTFPKDQLYKYYSGVCLVRLNRDPERAAILLHEAILGGSVARIVPSDAIYWQGRALQMAGQYDEAIGCFNTFSQESGRKDARDLKVSDYIDQCKRKEGKLFSSEPVHQNAANELKPETEIIAEKSLKIANREDEAPENTFSEKSLPVSYDNILSEAMLMHIKADSLYRIADSLKNNLDRLSYKEKTELRLRISNVENLALSFQKQADDKYSEAQASMNATPFAPTVPDVTKIPAARDSLPAEIKDIAPVKSVPEEGQPVKKDTITIVKNERKLVFSEFAISSKPIGSLEKVKINPVIPPGLIYRIQLAVFRNPVQLTYFKGITPVYGFKVAGTDKTNYYAGMFRRLADASKALSLVRQKGFRDAFIVSLSDGKAVSSERAALLEKEWGKKPFQQVIQPGMKVPADTIPPTLSFRVEVLRSAKPLKDDVLEGMKKLAGNRGLDREALADGSIVYLAGKFITYESAEEYAALLSKNGYRNAKVTAWLGKKEIPVDTARQLFENLE
jgi:tetratricopeptide (TPR) repeat protein